MTTYHPHGVKLSEGQKKKLAKAYRDNTAITIRLSNDELHGVNVDQNANQKIEESKKLGKRIRHQNIQNTDKKGCY